MEALPDDNSFMTFVGERKPMSKMRIAGLTAVLLLGACHSVPEDSGDQVASLASGPSAVAIRTPGGQPDSGRPQLRLDTNKQERDRYWVVYEDCLIAHGVKVNPTDQPGPAGDGPGRRLDQSGEPKAAYSACRNKLPLQPPELDEDKNPAYAVQWNDHIKCLRAHGLMVHVTAPGEWTWDDGTNSVPDNRSEIEAACLLEAFGGTSE